MFIRHPTVIFPKAWWILATVKAQVKKDEKYNFFRYCWLRRQTDRVSMLVMHSDNDSFPPGFSTPQVTLEIVADNEVSGSRRISAAGQHYYSWSRGPCQKLIRTTSNLLHTGLIIFQINSLSSFIIDTICDLHFLPFLCPKLGFDT